MKKWNGLQKKLAGKMKAVLYETRALLEARMLVHLGLEFGDLLSLALNDRGLLISIPNDIIFFSMVYNYLKNLFPRLECGNKYSTNAADIPSTYFTIKAAP